MYLYDDDAVMNDDDAAQLQNNLNALWNWTQGSLSKFNLSSCHQLTLTGKSKRTARKYTIGGEKPLTSVEYVKYLKVNVDSRLPFNEQIALEVKKANSLVAIFKKGFLDVTKDIRRTLYKASGRPHLEYAN